MGSPSLEQKNLAPRYWNVVIHSVIVFLGQSLMQIVDLMFCKHLGKEASATIGTASSLMGWFMILGLGLISSLEFLIPNSLGSGDQKRAGEYFYAGFASILILAVVSSIGLIGLSLLGPHYGMNPDIASSVQSFCMITAISYFPVFLIPLFRVELQAHGHPHATTLAFLYGNLLNILLNWMFVLGHLGFSAHGVIGSAYASVFARYGIFLFLVYRLMKIRKKNELVFRPNEIPFRARIREIIKMGFPTSLHLLFEIGAFIFVGLLASRLPTAESAAHAMVICIASFAFMIPAGMSSAAALTISRALGEKKQSRAKHYAKQTIKLGILYATIASLVFGVFRSPLLHAYTEDPDTLFIGLKILGIAAIFQFGDSMQVILAGCIRGFGETKTQAYANAIGHWVIGIPLGMYLGYTKHLGVAGFWIGLCVGLFSVAILLALRFRKILNSPVSLST